MQIPWNEVLPAGGGGEGVCLTRAAPRFQRMVAHVAGTHPTRLGYRVTDCTYRGPTELNCDKHGLTSLRTLRQGFSRLQFLRIVSSHNMTPKPHWTPSAQEAFTYPSFPMGIARLVTPPSRSQIRGKNRSQRQCQLPLSRHPPQHQTQMTRTFPRPLASSHHPTTLGRCCRSEPWMGRQR